MNNQKNASLHLSFALVSPAQGNEALLFIRATTVVFPADALYPDIKHLFH